MSAFRFADLMEERPEDDVYDDENDEVPLSDLENEEFPVRATFWALAMDDLLAAHKVRYERELEEYRIPEAGADEFAFARGEKRFKTGDGHAEIHGGGVVEECEGDKRVRKLRTLFATGFKTRIRPGEDPGAFRVIVPSDDQLYFLEECLFSVLPNVYGQNEWPVHCARVLKEWGREEIDYFVMMITARRVGKTWSVCMFDCGMLIYVPGFKINVYSTGRRASKMLKEQVEQFIHMTGEDNSKRIIQSNQEELFIAHKSLSMDNNRRSIEAITLRDDPSTSKLLSYPSSKKGKGKYTENRDAVPPP